MNRNKNDLFSQAVVGFFMLVVTGLLAYFTIIVSGVDIVSGNGKTMLTAAFDQVGGLKAHDNVMYRGTKVGAVERVTVTPSNLVVRAYIDRAVTLRRSCRIAVCNLSMLGGNYLLLEEGTGETVDIESAVFEGETPSDWMRDVSKIAKNLRELTEREEITGIVTNLEALSARANVIAGRLERGEGTLGKLLSGDERMYNDLAQATENLKIVTERLSKGEGTLGKLSADDELYTDIKGLVQDVRQTVDNYRDTTPITAFASLLMGGL
jgi:phospholipid/cholesterol/gamma-HCH transport system substrate-binding protein